MTTNKSTQPFNTGKKFSKKEIKDAVADWQSRQQTTRDALPSMVGSLPAPPMQFMDCMTIWMTAYATCMTIDQNVQIISDKQVANGVLLTSLAGLISSISACVASHHV